MKVLHQKQSLYLTLLVFPIIKNHSIRNLIKFNSAYDKRLKRYFGSDSRAKKYVADVSTLAEPFLEGESNLGTEVHMKFGDIQFVDENVDADGMCNGPPSRGVKNVIAKQVGNLTPMVIITEDKLDCPGGATTGCAYG